MVVGIESNNLWLSHKGQAIKVSGRHCRLATTSELIPWDDIHEHVPPIAEATGSQEDPDVPMGKADVNPDPPEIDQELADIHGAVFLDMSEALRGQRECSPTGLCTT